MKNEDLKAYVASLSSSDFDKLYQVVLEQKFRQRLGFATYKEVADLYRKHPPCPSCGFPDTQKDGFEANGLARFVCPRCNRKYNQLTQTIFEGAKSPLVLWLQFLEHMLWNMPLHGLEECVGISQQTAFEWRHRVFKTIKDYQDELVLSGVVWIEETYITDWELIKREPVKRGLSKQKYCIVVAIDADKHILAFVSGKGKPSSKRIQETLLKHIAPNTLIIHDKERSHKALVDALNATDFAIKANP